MHYNRKKSLVGIMCASMLCAALPLRMPEFPVTAAANDVAATIEESGSMAESGNPSWWGNSGAYLYYRNGIGRTIFGTLQEQDRWRKTYAESNPEDTDNGYRPQNIFRLVSKDKARNFTQEAYFKISAYNASESENRQGHNGFLFFNRYKDGQNLYYTGIRVDGKAVIKKKMGGTYYSMRLNAVYPGDFDRDSHPNLIPTGKWIGMRSVVKDNPDGSVSIKVYLDKEANGAWKLVAEAVDDGIAYGPVLGYSASTGIRTDFMDVEFKGYKVTEL